MKAMKTIPLSRSQQKPYSLKLLKEQGGVCPLCNLPINMKLQEGHRTDYALDHCHETGRIRGVLHRSCNGALGKMDNAIGRWGAKSMSYSAIVPYLRRVLAYYEEPLKPYIYPGHKTPEQQAEAARIKRNLAAVRRRAQERAKGIGK